MNDISTRAALGAGVLVAISTDAHAVPELEFMRWGVDQARRGWATAKQVANIRSLHQLRRLLRGGPVNIRFHLRGATMTYTAIHFSTLALGVAVLGVARPAAAQDTAAAAGVDSASIAAGRVLYQKRGACVPCHGEHGEGTPDGPSLVAGPWTLGDGSFAWLLHITRHAGWGTRGRAGDPRPMRGPTVLDSAEVRWVAAYVFSISRSKPRSK